MFITAPMGGKRRRRWNYWSVGYISVDPDKLTYRQIN